MFIIIIYLSAFSAGGFRGRRIYLCKWNLSQTNPHCHGNENLKILTEHLLWLNFYRRCVWHVKRPTTTVFLANHYSKVAACFLKVRNTIIVTGGMLHCSQRARQPMQPFQCSWPTLAVWWQRAVCSQECSHPSVLWHCWLGDRKSICSKSSATTIPSSLLLGTRLTWSNHNLLVKLSVCVCSYLLTSQACHYLKWH